MNVSRHARLPRRSAALAVAVITAVGVAACSGGSTTAAPGPAAVSSTAATSAATSPAASAASSPAASSPEASSPAAAPGQLVAITVAGGKVSGPSGRVKIKKGSVVTLRVTSDVADEVHLHGYDKSVDVEKGGTADLTFTASLTGVFEVELEQRALQLTQLQVQ